MLNKIKAFAKSDVVKQTISTVVFITVVTVVIVAIKVGVDAAATNWLHPAELSE